MLKYILVFLWLFVPLQSVKCEIPLDDINTNEVFIQFTNLAIYMTRRFISLRTNTVVVAEQCKIGCSLKQNYHSALMTRVLSGIHDKFAIQLFLGFYDDRFWDYNIFIVDSHGAFEMLRFMFPSTQNERFFNFFVLLTWGANNAVELNETLYKIFKTSLNFNVKNVVVMCKSFEGSHFSFYTYEFFNKENCEEKIIIREINRYENGTLENEYLFLDHIRDFHGCYLNVSAHAIQPLLNFKGDTKNETQLMESYRLSGVDGEVLKLIAEALNFRIRLRFPEERNNINKHFHSTGCFKDLENNYAQIAIGGFGSNLLNSYKFTSSVVYHTTPYVFVVRSGLCFGPITQLLNPFCLSTWMLISFILFVSFIFIKLVQIKTELSDFIFGPKNKKPVSSMLVIFLGYSLPTKIVPKRNFARFLLAAWLLLSFEVRNGYQGKLFDSLRFSKRITVPHTISEITEQGYTVLTSEYTGVYLGNKAQIMHNTTERLDLLQSTDSRLAATALLDSFAYYNYINFNTSTLTYVDEAIHMISCVMFFQKHSIFRSSIDRKINIFHDAGIISHIAKKHTFSAYKNINMKSQFKAKLSNDSLIGVYYINIGMFLVSIFVFILELLTCRSSNLSKIMEILNSL